jgi:hypothetical protein
MIHIALAHTLFQGCLELRHWMSVPPLEPTRPSNPERLLTWTVIEFGCLTTRPGSQRNQAIASGIQCNNRTHFAWTTKRDTLHRARKGGSGIGPTQRKGRDTYMSVAKWIYTSAAQWSQKSRIQALQIHPTTHNPSSCMSFEAPTSSTTLHAMCLQRPFQHPAYASTHWTTHYPSFLLMHRSNHSLPSLHISPRWDPSTESTTTTARQHTHAFNYVLACKTTMHLPLPLVERYVKLCRSVFLMLRKLHAHA